MLLVVGATERELAFMDGADTLCCGVGPVEAAANTARALWEWKPERLLHIGIAGARGVQPPTLVLGKESVYEDARGPLIPSRVEADTTMLAIALEALPEAHLLAIGTSARVGGAAQCHVEAMEGFAVLRAAQLAGVPAIELRAISNDVDEPDRNKWQFEEAFAALGEAVPKLVAALG
ncbi:MAG TPA: hypothetical protein VFM96_07845 [Gaiellaceae bacterium]|nr:hypothetical protein [Gaiellaceae bacterium]